MPPALAEVNYTILPPAQDCVALLALKDSVSSANPLNWGADTPIGQWEGVTVADVTVEDRTAKRVTKVEVTNRSLSGSLPPELGKLTELRRLVVFGNNFSGSIPPELGKLTKLTWLGLADNDLSGAIPPQLGNLTQLHGLGLHDNNLSGEIPSELGNLTNLQHLYLHGNGSNAFTGCIPSALMRVPHNTLQQLGLPFCEN